MANNYPVGRLSLYQVIIAVQIILLSAVTVNAAHAEPIRYESANGGVLILNLADGVWQNSSGATEKLADCGDETQTCFSNGRDFGFSFPKDCRDYMLWPARLDPRQKFRPFPGSSLHGHIWVVFLDHPKYLFEYVETLGVTAIYLKTDGSPDFGELVKRRDSSSWNLADFEPYAFRHSIGTGIAACR